MVKKILTVLIVALFFVLVGLLVLFFYLNKSINKKNSVLSFIPIQTEFILKLRETSQTTNKFFSKSIVNDCFYLPEIKEYWQAIDSITSRNYKTSDVLAKNTSYICIDSSNRYLILVDLDKKTNEHFIDQFLVGTTSSRKIKKFNEGYKAFYPKEDEPLYYFVKQNVFGISADQEYIKQALINSSKESIDPDIQNWEESSLSDISVWGRSGSEAQIINRFTGDFMFGGWLDKWSTSFSFDLFIESNKITSKGQLRYDSLHSEISKFALKTDDLNSHFFQADTGVYQNYSFNLLVADSIGSMQPCRFTFSSFKDTSGATVQFIVSSSALAIKNFKNAIDTSVQIIPMADENIPEIVVMNKQTCDKIIPIMPYNKDTAKWFGVVYNEKLFITNSTEFILTYVPTYPAKNFIKTKLEANDLIFSSNQKLFNKLYSLQYKYQWVKGNQIVFTSIITIKGAN